MEEDKCLGNTCLWTVMCGPRALHLGLQRQRPAPGLFGPVAEGRILVKQVSAFCASGQCCLALQSGRGNDACRGTNA